MDSCGLKPREPRRKVHLPARMRVHGGWVDVNIGDVSVHGLMFVTATPPRPGTIIEIRRGPLVIVGRAIWSVGARCGVRTQDTVDMDSLGQSGGSRASDKNPLNKGVTLQQKRLSDARQHRDQAERSRALGHLMQYGAGLAWAAAGGAVLMFVVMEAMGRITTPIMEAMM